MVKRLVITLILLVVGFLSVGFIPSDPEIREAAVRMDLPEKISGWRGYRIEPSPLELKILADDTQYEKRHYFWLPAARGYDDIAGFERLKGVMASIVLSGHDLNNSIHRPERCLEAQGFKGLKVSTVDLDLGDGRTMPVRRIHCYRDEIHRDSKIRLNYLYYYWFVGFDAMTESHYLRHLKDMKDRLVGGYNQRWAFFGIQSLITEGLLPVGARTEEETDKLLQDFCRDVYNDCVISDRLANAPGE